MPCPPHKPSEPAYASCRRERALHQRALSDARLAQRRRPDAFAPRRPGRDPASRTRRLRPPEDKPLRGNRPPRRPRGGRGHRAQQWRDGPGPRRGSRAAVQAQHPGADAPVFHTSASSRTIRIGNITVRMVHTSNRRRLQFAGEATGAALSALWYLGKNNVTPETAATIEAALGPAGFQRLRSADMPAWMTRVLAAADRDAVHG